MANQLNYGTGDPQSMGSVEWISYRFSELEPDDLFWFTKSPDGDVNSPFRKIGENLALDLVNQKQVNVESTLQVHQKEY